VGEDGGRERLGPEAFKGEVVRKGGWDWSKSVGGDAWRRKTNRTVKRKVEKRKYDSRDHCFWGTFGGKGNGVARK